MRHHAHENFSIRLSKFIFDDLNELCEPLLPESFLRILSLLRIAACGLKFVPLCQVRVTYLT